MNDVREFSVPPAQARIRYWQEAFPAGEITKEKIMDQFQGWDAHAAHGVPALRSEPTPDDLPPWM